MNKLIRPCTLPSVWVGVLDGKDIPFMIDAIRFEGLHYTPSTSYNPKEYFIVRVDLCNPRTTAMAYHPKENVEHLMRRTLGVIYEALNAPVLVTEEVLAGLPKDARILGRLVHFDEDEKPDHPDAKWQEIEYSFLFKEWRYSVRSLFPVASTHNMVRWYIIKSNGCSKTAEYLRKFYTDGTPVSKGGSND